MWLVEEVGSVCIVELKVIVGSWCCYVMVERGGRRVDEGYIYYSSASSQSLPPQLPAIHSFSVAASLVLQFTIQQR
jgi:hypothetical protein